MARCCWDSLTGHLRQPMSGWRCCLIRSCAICPTSSRVSGAIRPMSLSAPGCGRRCWRILCLKIPRFTPILQRQSGKPAPLPWQTWVLGCIAQARAEQPLAWDASEAVQPSRMVFSNTARLVLGIATEMMNGEVAFKSGEVEEGLEHLRRAVFLEDSLLSDEPWGRMQPTRHALGALLLEAGRYAKAEAVYRASGAGSERAAFLPTSRQRLDSARAARRPGAVRRQHRRGIHQAGA